MSGKNWSLLVGETLDTPDQNKPLKYLHMRQFCFLIFFLAILSGPGKTQAIDTLEWTILTGGTKKAGFLKTWKNPDGSYTELSQYNDRGRGDSTVSRYFVDELGYFEFIEANGVDYFKKPVFESFKIENGIAYWENNAEKGQKRLESKALYVPLSISVGTSFKSYFNTASRTNQLLPTGTSRLKVLKKLTLKDGKKIRLISTIGMGLIPNYSWIDDNDELFAYPGDWFAYILKGYESYNKDLLDIQEEFENKYFEDIAKKLMSRTQKWFCSHQCEFV